MSMESIRNRYNVPAKRGMEVKIVSRPSDEEIITAKIVGSKGSYLRLLLPSARKSGLYHPTDSIEYPKDEPTQISIQPPIV